MSRACMIGHSAAGHVNPTLPVIAELRRRGEGVTYFASEPFRAAIESAGAVFRSCGSHDLFERNLGRGGLLGGMAGLIRTTEEILPGLLEAVREERPDYLLIEAHAVWGNLLAQILGLPAATLCSMFAVNERLIGPAELIRNLYGSAPAAAALEGLSALGDYFETARRLGRRYGVRCPGVVDYIGNPQRLNLVFTSREFQPGGAGFDESYEFVGPPVGRNDCSAANGLARSGDGDGFPWDRLGSRPLILIAMGTMYNDAPEFYRACFAAFGGELYQVALAVGHRMAPGALGAAPGNFIVREYLPQTALLEHSSLFITHGGINSAHEAMLGGVPMLALPSRADHYIVASQVEAAGAGAVLDRSQATAPRLAELAERVLGDPAYRENSRKMGETLRRAGGPARAADAIFAFKKGAGIG